MVSVLQVYNALKDLTNKEQKGFVTPQVFNSFAALAQMNIYNELFTELVGAKKLGRQSFDPGRDKSVRKQRLEDLAFFIRRKDLPFTAGSELLSKPTDLSKVISLTVDSFVDTTESGVVEDRVTCELVYDPEKMDRIVGSNLSAPTSNFPVALVSTKDIEIFPDEVEIAILTYYAKPSSFDSDGNISLGSPFYDFEVVSFNGDDLPIELPTSNCRDFMLPPHYLTEVVMEMAKLLGVRLRDPNIQTFASQEEASE